MEVHRQRCQNCSSIDVHNLLVREVDRSQTVYVRCSQCEQLVARYVLADYYHHGRGIESYLRTRQSGFSESARDVAAELASVEQSALEGYERAVQYLRDRGKEP